MLKIVFWNTSWFRISDSEWWRQKKMASFERILFSRKRILIDDKYEIIRKIGSGSFGDIFLAKFGMQVNQIWTRKYDSTKQYSRKQPVRYMILAFETPNKLILDSRYSQSYLFYTVPNLSQICQLCKK